MVEPKKPGESCFGYAELIVRDGLRKCFEVLGFGVTGLDRIIEESGDRILASSFLFDPFKFDEFPNSPCSLIWGLEPIAYQVSVELYVERSVLNLHVSDSEEEILP